MYGLEAQGSTEEGKPAKDGDEERGPEKNNRRDVKPEAVS